MTLSGQLPALTWAIFAAWVLGAILLGILSLLPKARAKITPLWYLMASEFLILAIGVLPWHLPALLLGLLLAGAALRIGYEAGHVYGLATGRALSLPCAAVLATATGVLWFSPLAAWHIVGLAGVAAVSTLAVLLLRDWRLTAPARFLLYPAIPFLAFALTGRFGDAAMMVLAFLYVELFDSFSLLGGKLFGRTPLVPRLSPRKTWEGLATGCFALALSSWAIAAYLGLDVAGLMLLAGVAAIAALAGDLTASAIKRKAGVKDYPAVLPVQGGLLDIVDSWIVAAPLMMLASHFLIAR